MGWKGTLRSMSAVMRAAERDAQRRQKNTAKQQMFVNSGQAVEDYEQYLKDIVSIHTRQAEALDWFELANKPEPLRPELKATSQQKAEEALIAFKPGFMDRFRGGSAKRRVTLENSVLDARSKDQQRYEKELNSFEADRGEWIEETSLAKRLVEGDAAAMKEVVEEMQSLTSEGLLGSYINFSFKDGVVHAQPVVHGSDIVPRVRRKQLASGRLSESKMPESQVNELYQDYVCSAAIRVAGDLFCITPTQEVYVTCSASMLNLSTGHDEETPILSVHFVRTKFETMRLSSIDPSDAICSYRHAMNFRRAKGFLRVEPLIAI